MNDKNKNKNRWDSMPRRSIGFLRLPYSDVVLLREHGYTVIPELLKSISLVLNLKLTRKGRERLEEIYEMFTMRKYKPKKLPRYKESINLPSNMTRAEIAKRANDYMNSLVKSKSYEEILHDNKRKNAK